MAWIEDEGGAGPPPQGGETPPAGGEGGPPRRRRRGRRGGRRHRRRADQGAGGAAAGPAAGAAAVPGAEPEFESATPTVTSPAPVARRTQGGSDAPAPAAGESHPAPADAPREGPRRRRRRHRGRRGRGEAETGRVAEPGPGARPPAAGPEQEPAAGPQPPPGMARGDSEPEYEEVIEEPIAGSWRGSGALEITGGESGAPGAQRERPRPPAPHPRQAASGPRPPRAAGPRRAAPEARGVEDEIEPLVGELVRPAGQGPEGRKRRRRRRGRGRAEAGGLQIPPRQGGRPAPEPAGRVAPDEAREPEQALGDEESREERGPTPEVGRPYSPPAGGGTERYRTRKRAPEPVRERRRRLTSPKTWSFGPTHWGPGAIHSAEELIHPPPKKRRRKKIPPPPP